MRIERIGDEKNPLLIADGALKKGDVLMRAAQAGHYSAEGSPYYPGVRAPAPEAYAQSLARALAKPLAEAFGWRPGSALRPLVSTFSLVTTAPEQLVPLQRIPHMDGTDPDIVAVLHYLCGEEMGGTSFFRHKSTGFERISADRHPVYDAALKADFARHGMPPPRYVGVSGDIFEEIAAVDARFDRLLAYSGAVLHSGRIPEDFAFSADPARGRLTVNTFLRRTDPQ